MPPTLANGKVCYIEIPTADAERSAAFYHTVFGWSIRRRSDGHSAFDDGVGEVSGSWVEGRAPSRDAGVLIYVMVDDIQETMCRIFDAGGEIVEPPRERGEIIARFRDPDGNMFGLYQERG
ncbi:MAG TPA: VOC family protein [Gemmatimonadaceae bacterium]|nr:VOC family protein [Gemmatimonadaceae bacterium]